MSDKPAQSGGMSPMKMGLGLGVLVLLNYVFNELMDDSGLTMVLLTARLPVGTNSTGRASFRAQAELTGMTTEDASGIGALRFELMEQQSSGGDAENAPFTAAIVARGKLGDAALPAWLATELGPVEATRRLTTLFPERARWRTAAPQLEPGELGEIGRTSLLVQQSSWTLKSFEAADAFKRSWPDLGYNALGEPGVVRCDLLLESTSEDGQTTQLVARKVFRHAAALEEHERSEHFARWKAGIAAAGVGAEQPREVQLFHTLLPRTSAYPFRTRWATA